MDRFKDKLTERMKRGESVKGFPADLVKRTKSKILLVLSARSLDDLRIPPSNRLEKLKGTRGGQWSIRVNDKYRICFDWSGDEASEIEFTDYH